MQIPAARVFRTPGHRRRAASLDLSSSGTLRLVQEELERSIAAEVMSATAKVRAMGADPFGLGLALYTRNPATWKSLAPAWQEVLTSVPVTVTVHARIIRTGLSLASHRER